MLKQIKLLAIILTLLFVMTPQSHAVVVSCNGIPDSSGNCPLSIDDSGYTTFNGGLYQKYEAKTTNDTLTAAETSTTYIVTPSSATTITLPAAAAGLAYKFVTGNMGNSGKWLTVNPDDADIIVFANSSVGLTMAAGDAVRNSGLTGDSLELIAVGTGYWYATDVRGTWTDVN